MRWGTTILTIGLLVTLILASGCTTNLGTIKLDFGNSNEAREAMACFNRTYGDPMAYNGPPRFIAPLASTGLKDSIPLDKVTKFSTGTNSIFFWVIYQNFQQGDDLQISWIFQNKVVTTITKKTGSQTGVAFGEFIRPDAGWPVGTHTIKIEGKGTGTQVTFDVVNGPTERTIFNFTSPNGVSCPDLISYAPAALVPVANISPVTPGPVQGGDTSFPLKISASPNTVQWCDPVTFSVSDTTGSGQVYISFNGPGMPPQVIKWGITIANLVRPAAPSIDWTYTWDTSEHYDGFTKQAAGYTVYAFDENQVHVISMPLQMKGDKLVNGQCPGTVSDYFISGSVSNQGILSCSPPNNIIKFSGSTGSAVAAGTPIQLKIFNEPISGPQDLPQSGILFGSTNVDNSGLWEYSWNGNVPGYTLKNGQDYLVKVILSDTNYNKFGIHYQCPTQQCSSNQTNCNGICIMPQNDPSNCGMCGHVCLQGQTCQNGQCVATTVTPTCTAGAMLCNGQCVFVLSNPNNCGSCGNVCVGGQTCVYDTCRCNSGQMFCNGQCIDIMQNSNNCGACGAACGANQYCLNAKCTDKVQGVVTTSAVRKFVPVTTTLTIQIPVPR